MNNLLNKFSKEELQETLKILNLKRLCLNNFKHKEKYKEILLICKNSLNNFKQLLNYYLQNNSVPICKICNKEGIYFTSGKLRDCCSNKCQLKYKIVKVKQTNLEKYGVENVSQLKETQDKIKKNNLEKYGVEHVLQSNIINEKSKQTCIEKYGSIYFNNRTKSKQTCIEKYGVEYVLQ